MSAQPRQNAGFAQSAFQKEFAEFVGFIGEGILTLAAGMYPFSVPTEPVRQAMAELDFPDPHCRFHDGLRTGLTTWLIGAAAQSPS